MWVGNKSADWNPLLLFDVDIVIAQLGSLYDTCKADTGNFQYVLADVASETTHFKNGFSTFFGLLLELRHLFMSIKFLFSLLLYYLFCNFVFDFIFIFVLSCLIFIALQSILASLHNNENLVHIINVAKLLC